MIKITNELATTLLPKRKENSNKSDFGKVLNITGSNKYLGAGVLSALASLKVGAGYSFLCSQNDAVKCYEKFSPDLIYKTHDNFNADIMISIIEEINPKSIVLGCGISLNENTIVFTDKITDYIKTKNIPAVIDADALNALSVLKKENLGKNFVLTPHPKELSRLIDTDTHEIIKNKEKYIEQAANKFNSTIILKGHNTLICESNNIYENHTGNNALAKAGSGDVLAGILGGFLAQNLSPKDASILSVYLHGLAAEIYSDKYCEYSLLASELLNYIPDAIKLIMTSSQKLYRF